MPSPKGLIQIEKMSLFPDAPTLRWAWAQILQSKYCQSHFMDELTEAWKGLIPRSMPQGGSGKVKLLA